jgi:hypothetical protein
MTVTKEHQILNYEDLMDETIRLVDEGVKNRKLSVQDRMRLMSSGIRNSAIINNELRARRRELRTYGSEINGDLKAMTFNPTADAGE